MRQHLIISRGKKAIEQDIEFRIRRKDFQDRVKAFREKYKITNLSEETRENVFSQYNKWGKEHIWLTDLVTMIDELGLHQEWQPIVFDYITTGKYSIDDDPEGIKIYEEKMELLKITRRDFLIKIYPSTGIEDIKRAWPQIKKYIGQTKSSKPKISENFKRNEYIYHLREEEKLPYSTISGMVGKKYGMEHTLDENHLSSIVAKEKKKLKKIHTSYIKK